ncbi:hypothetical protein BT96DRAFT_1010123 [Gymnopus androsaceus JB14]|uniref:Uncharacterized protein n=1 Tax=Gymnopus androsaceus JB14 TaxID=1447944 RepID=A0A6A4GB68_9AGAR|nr:hypothetical protein BT96DRAFT_1010123 [Gymnopus androsaceus JB14]
MAHNSNFALLVAAPQSSLAMWEHCTGIEHWTLESSSTPCPFKDNCAFYFAYCTPKGHRIWLLFSKKMNSAMDLLLAFFNFASASILTSQSMYMPSALQPLSAN